MKTLQCDAFLFDVDSTLVNSSACIESVWRIWSEKYGFELEQVLAAVHGRKISETLGMIAPEMNAEKFLVEIQNIALHAFKNVREVKGAKTFLSKLPPESWAISTSGARQVSLSSMNNAGLPLPAAVVAAEDVVHGKPDPEPYIRAAKLLGVKAENCIVFEDSLAGIQSGRTAGATVIALTTTHRAEELTGLDFLIQDFSQLEVRANQEGAGLRFELLIHD
jgi:mannitol-1-/sugar-/sorbitol-6-phosphatase